jgi:hypothetical protein
MMKNGSFKRVFRGGSNFFEGGVKGLEYTLPGLAAILCSQLYFLWMILVVVLTTCDTLVFPIS